jgi:hypothetical protein
MSSIRKFWKKRQNAADSSRIARGREFYGAKLTVLYVTHPMTAIMLS